MGCQSNIWQNNHKQIGMLATERPTNSVTVHSLTSKREKDEGTHLWSCKTKSLFSLSKCKHRNKVRRSFSEALLSVIQNAVYVWTKGQNTNTQSTPPWPHTWSTACPTVGLCLIWAAHMTSCPTVRGPDVQGPQWTAYCERVGLPTVAPRTPQGGMFAGYWSWFGY